MLDIRITKLDERASIPKYETEQSAAMDLTIIEDISINPGEQALLRTGLGFGIPEDHVMTIFPRSSTYKKFGILFANSVGIIDADYAGTNDEVCIVAFNPGTQPVTIKAGSRVAQFMILPRPRIRLIEGPPETVNRGGFGSTGGHGA